jgi:hypothetical protein
LRLGEASELLELSYRQAKRIWARYRGGGAKALQHGNCGRRSNRAYAEKFRTTVLEQVRHRYEEFGPTLALVNKVVFETAFIRQPQNGIGTWH